MPDMQLTILCSSCARHQAARGTNPSHYSSTTANGPPRRRAPARSWLTATAGSPNPGSAGLGIL